jgi:NADH pyrophosphatase NudC (nudix superfamily)
MYITPSLVAAVEEQYGVPLCISRVVEMNAEQLAKVKIGTRGGRRHDVTMFIVKDGRVVLTRKHGYSQGVYRAPSGGIEHGESFEAGTLREAMEETGLQIKILRYLIRCDVEFRTSTEVISWTTHAMQCWTAGDQLLPIDTHEIAEARWVDMQEALGPIQVALKASGSPGLLYRAELDEMALRLINRSIV